MQVLVGVVAVISAATLAILLFSALHKLGVNTKIGGSLAFLLWLGVPLLTVVANQVEPDDAGLIIVFWLICLALGIVAARQAATHLAEEEITSRVTAVEARDERKAVEAELKEEKNPGVFGGGGFTVCS